MGYIANPLIIYIKRTAFYAFLPNLFAIHRNFRLIFIQNMLYSILVIWNSRFVIKQEDNHDYHIQRGGF